MLLHVGMNTSSASQRLSSRRPEDWPHSSICFQCAQVKTLKMKLVVSILAFAITVAQPQDSSTTTTLDSSSWVGGTSEAQQFRDRFKTESPQLPTLPPPTITPTSSSSSSSGISVGWSSSNSEASAGASVASSDEDYSIEHDPSSSNDIIVVGSESGSGMFMNDDPSASTNSDTGSARISTRSIAFFMSASMATVIVNALTLS